jgi:CheY-like chemotaxis protein
MADIVVGDDESAHLEFLLTYLSGQGHIVRTAADGMAVLKEIQDKEPALLLLDLKMPKMDGGEVLNRLKTIAPSLPVVLISAMRHPELSEKIDADQILFFLKKPISLDELDWAISHTVRTHAKTERSR